MVNFEEKKIQSDSDKKLQISFLKCSYLIGCGSDFSGGPNTKLVTYIRKFYNVAVKHGLKTSGCHHFIT